jgi:hypothetical protein
MVLAQGVRDAHLPFPTGAGSRVREPRKAAKRAAKKAAAKGPKKAVEEAAKPPVAAAGAADRRTRGSF